MSEISDLGWREILSLYDQLPSNGKPVADREFTVLAAIVGTRHSCGSDSNSSSNSERCMVLSLATGTKCVGQEQILENGTIVHDSHAEVTARRGFLLYLYRWIEVLLEDSSAVKDPLCPLQWKQLKVNSDQIVLTDTVTEQFVMEVKPGWLFHLFVSDSPCGDASIYEVEQGGVSFTGAKLVSGNASLLHSSVTNTNSADTDTTVTYNCAASVVDNPNEIDRSGLIWRREEEQVLGAVRTKSGRSDMAAHVRTSSMSCSDKICRWRCTGLQG